MELFDGGFAEGLAVHVAEDDGLGRFGEANAMAYLGEQSGLLVDGIEYVFELFVAVDGCGGEFMGKKQQCEDGHQACGDD